MDRHHCRSSCLYLLLLILHVAITNSQSGDRPLPPLPRDYFSGYVERIIVSPAADQGAHPAVSLTWSAYDADLKLFREDSHVPDTPSGSEQGTRSVIEDWRIGVVYSIDRQSLSCDIKSLDNQSAVDNFHRRTLQENLLSLNYTYSGTRVVRSLLVDSWTSHDISTGSNISVTFTRPGTAVSSLQSLMESPRLWHYAINSSNSSSVMNFYGLSFDKPNIDVFDISVCFSDEESELLVLFLPGRLSGVDVNHLRSSIREAIANYTGIYPLQIGNIKIIGENGSFIITSVQLSNLTSLATVQDKIPAYKAVQTIHSNLKGQTLPFPVELKPGVNVFPILHDINVVGNSSHSMSSVQPSHSVSSVQSVSSSHWSTHHSPSAVIMTSLPLITSLSSPSSTLQPVVTTTTSAHSISCPVAPSNSPLQLTVTQTVTETLPCQPQSTVVVMPTTQPHTAVYPTPGVEDACIQSLSTGGVIGVAIGAFVGGIFTTFLTIACCVLCCNVCHCNRTSKRSGGWRPLPKTDYNVSKEMDYFQ